MLPKSTSYFKLMLTMLCWGGTWLAGRIAVAEAPPLAVAFYRFLIASVCLAYCVYHAHSTIPKLNARQWLTTALLGATGIFAYNIFFLYGLQHISAGHGALVVAFNPVAVTIFSWLWLKETMSVKKTLGVITALGGCFFVISNGSPMKLLNGGIGYGEWLILGCVACWTLYTFIGRIAHQQGLSPLIMTFYAVCIGCAMFAILAVYQGVITDYPHYSIRVWASIIFLGVFGTALGFTWFIGAVSQVGPTHASAFLNLVPIWAILLGVVFLGEHLNKLTLLGGALVLIGVFLTTHKSLK